MSQNAGREAIKPIAEAHTNLINFYVDENPYADDPQAAGWYVIDGSSRTKEQNDGFPRILDSYATEAEARREAKVWQDLMMGERVMRFKEEWRGLPAGTPVVYCTEFVDVRGETIYVVRSVDNSKTMPVMGRASSRTNVPPALLVDV